MDKLLARNGFLDLTVRDRMVVMARTGRFWLTRPGDEDDYLLGPGEALSLPQGRWLVQALAAGLLSCTDEVPVPQKIEFGRSSVEAGCLPSLSRV